MAKKISNDNKKPRFTRTKITALSAALAFGGVAGCTTTNERNVDVYNTADTFAERVERLEIGMDKSDVLSILSGAEEGTKAYDNTEKTMVAIEEKKFKRLAVYGDERAPTTFDEKEKERVYMNTLDVYTIRFENTRSKEVLGWKDVKETDRGYEMSTTLIFQDGALLEDPKVNGGFIEVRSETSHLKNIGSKNILKSLF